MLDEPYQIPHSFFTYLFIPMCQAPVFAFPHTFNSERTPLPAPAPVS
jgi:hypothetical protein